MRCSGGVCNGGRRGNAVGCHGTSTTFVIVDADVFLANDGISCCDYDGADRDFDLCHPGYAQRIGCQDGCRCTRAEGYL